MSFPQIKKCIFIIRNQANRFCHSSYNNMQIMQTLRSLQSTYFGKEGIEGQLYFHGNAPAMLWCCQFPEWCCWTIHPIPTLGQDWECSGSSGVLSGTAPLQGFPWPTKKLGFPWRWMLDYQVQLLWNRGCMRNLLFVCYGAVFLGELCPLPGTTQPPDTTPPLPLLQQHFHTGLINRFNLASSTSK